MEMTSRSSIDEESISHIQGKNEKREDMVEILEIDEVEISEVEVVTE